MDGIGAYDHVLRAAMLTRLSKMSNARKLLPFVRLSYARPSSYAWFDAKGERHNVRQAEGGEQGDPLMPLLFSIGIQSALEVVAGQLHHGENVCAFLDDVYILCQPARVHVLHSVLEATLLSVAGIRLNQGKTRAWNKGAIVPESIDDISPDAWQPAGIKVLGTPIGSDEYVADRMSERIAKESALWHAIPTIPDLQCAWQLLLQSANPRANHAMRTLPPSVSRAYCEAHDKGIWSTAKLLIGVSGSTDTEEVHQLASLPMRMGGLGLRSATRCAAAAFWASWADALPMIRDRTPQIANLVLTSLSSGVPPSSGCLAEVHAAATELDHQGFWQRPSWNEIWQGKRPDPSEARDPGEWQHGWQYWASSVTDSFFRKTTMLTSRPASRRAHLRSHSGRNAGIALAHAPTAPEYTIPAHLFRVLLLERLRLPLPISDALCDGCHERLDSRGCHRAACTRTGRIRKRATPTEKMLARICREAGARVQVQRVPS